MASQIRICEMMQYFSLSFCYRCEVITRWKCQDTGNRWCLCLSLPVWSIVQSGPRRVACNWCCSVSNVPGEACWWSRHLKPALHLSSELVCIFLSPSLVCSLLTFSLVCRCLFCSVLIPFVCLSYCVPLSVHFLLSPFIPYTLNPLSACISLSLTGFLVLSISLARRQESGTFLFSLW